MRRIGVFGRIHGRTNTHLILARRCFKRGGGGGERGAAEQARRDVTTRRATPLPLRKVMGQFGTCFWFGLERWRGVEVCCVAVRPKNDISILVNLSQISVVMDNSRFHIYSSLPGADKSELA